MRRPLLAVAAATALAAGAAFGPAATAATPVDPLAYGFQGEGGLLADDADLREGVVRPTAAQRAAVDALGARAVWNSFGTPKVLTRDDAGFLSAPHPGAPADAARAFVRDNLALFGLPAELTTPAALTVTKDVPLLEAPELRAKMKGAVYPDRAAPHVVTLQQVFAGAPAGLDGTVTLGLDPENRVAYVSSSLTREVAVANDDRISLTDAYRAAAKNAKVDLTGLSLDVTDERTPKGAAVLRLEGIADQQTVRLVTLPTPRDGVRLAYEVVVLRSTPGAELGEYPYAYISLVDAETGEVLHRRNRLQHAADAAGSPGTASVPYWKVFENAPDFPKAGVQTPDNRLYWCFTAGPECARVLGAGNAATPRAYDVLLTDDGSEAPTLTTRGNNAQTAPSRASFLTPDAAVSPVSPGRTYDFPFTDAWHTSNCDPTTLVDPSRQLNDIDAATTNLFVMHNRMHDWGYYLGWTEENSNLQVENVGSEADAEERENDPELGNSQSGSIGGGPTFQGRDNANQITLTDGTPGITNQYLWEPLQAGFYAPCTDGAYDMGIVGHEVGHAISNRMTDGSNGLSGAQAGSMGEAWSDLMAVEYLNGYGLAPYADENRYSLAPYVTGDKKAGIRNYGMNDSPLNFSNIEYDGNGVSSPHADGEIWSATQFDIRQAMIAKYDGQFPSSNTALQVSCADGLKPTTACPGNRRWIQLIFDGYLLQPGSTSMLDSRDAILAADKMRYAGANLPALWAGFAKRGMGADAFTESSDDREPEADFRNPTSAAANGTVRFRAVSADGSALPEEANVYIGRYEARITPIATTAGGATSAAKRFQAGTYEIYVQAPGFGHRRLSMTVAAGSTRTIDLPLRRNLASLERGAEVAGDGGNLEALVDDTEGTNWGSIGGGKLNPTEASTVQGKQVTVALAGGKQTISEVQVSAANRPAVCTGDAAAACEYAPGGPYDAGGQSRFAALRSFEILTCDATAGSECAAEEDFTSRLVAKDAFPAGRPRPTAPDLALRTFAIPTTAATHVRIKVVDNQCTGGPDYTGEANPSNNPLSSPDCESGYASAAAAGAPKTTVSLSQGKNVRIAELQVFGSRTVAPPAAPPAGPPAAPVPDAAPPQAAPPSGGGALPATGPLPLALPALLLTGLGVALVRGRRRGL